MGVEVAGTVAALVVGLAGTTVVSSTGRETRKGNQKQY